MANSGVDFRWTRICAVGVVSGFGVSAALPSQAQEVAYWRMENATASQANSSALDFALGPTAGFLSYDLPGTQVSDGINTYANASVYDNGLVGASTVFDSAILNDAITIGADFTIEAFVKFTPGATNHTFEHFIGNSVAGATPSGWYFSTNELGKLEFGAVAGNANGFVTAQSPNTLTEGIWHHVAAVGTFDAGGELSDKVTIQLFENYNPVGAARSFQSLAGSGPVIKSNTTDYLLGGINPFDGWFDELRISAAALTPDQFLVASGGQPTPPERAADFGKQWVRDHPVTIMGAAVGTTPSFDLNEYLGAGMTTVFANNSNFNESGVAAKAVAGGQSWIQLWTANSFSPGTYQPFTPLQESEINALIRRGGGIGWMLPDEPEQADLPALQQQADFIRKAHPQMLIVVNVAYDDPVFLDNLMTTVRPDALMFDVYPFRTDGSTLTNPWFDTVMAIRNKAKASDIPYWAFLQSLTVPGAPFREPSESDLRYNAFTLLTAGYTGLSYFSYDNQAGSGLEGFFDSSGNRKAVYDLAASVNSEIAAVGKSLRFLTSEEVRFVSGGVSGAPTGLIHWSPGAGGDNKILSVSVDGAAAVGKDGLLGLFTDDDGHRFFMLTNLNHGPSATAAATGVDFTVQFDASVTELLRLNRITGQQELIVLTDNTLDLALLGGTGDLLKYNDGIFPGFILGDFDDNDTIVVDDIDALFAKINAGGVYDSRFDLTHDGSLIDGADVDELILNIIGTGFGDTNLDYSVDLADLNALLGHFNSSGGWAEGDFTGDGLVGLADLNILLGNYNKVFDSANTFVVATTPEPATLMIVVVGLFACGRGPRCYGLVTR